MSAASWVTRNENSQSRIHAAVMICASISQIRLKVAANPSVMAGLWGRVVSFFCWFLFSLWVSSSEAPPHEVSHNLLNVY
ncbi:hypothetical protein AAFF_G00374980, partial [Aldrovandia affinis]